jgi:hypothetical protein
LTHSDSRIRRPAGSASICPSGAGPSKRKCLLDPFGRFFIMTGLQKRRVRPDRDRDRMSRRFCRNRAHRRRPSSARACSIRGASRSSTGLLLCDHSTLCQSRAIASIGEPMLRRKTALMRRSP